VIRRSTLGARTFAAFAVSAPRAFHCRCWITRRHLSFSIAGHLNTYLRTFAAVLFRLVRQFRFCTSPFKWFLMIYIHCSYELAFLHYSLIYITLWDFIDEWWLKAVFSARQHYMHSALCYRPSVRPSVCLFVTRVDQSTRLKLELRNFHCTLHPFL